MITSGLSKSEHSKSLKEIKDTRVTREGSFFDDTRSRSSWRYRNAQQSQDWGYADKADDEYVDGLASTEDTEDTERAATPQHCQGIFNARTLLLQIRSPRTLGA